MAAQMRLISHSKQRITVNIYSTEQYFIDKGVVVTQVVLSNSAHKHWTIDSQGFFSDVLKFVLFFCSGDQF